MRKQPAATRLFHLNRKEDHTGISGTGIVARGVIFPSGKCVMEWQTKHTSVAAYDSIDEVRAIHGHDGKTEIVLGAADPDALLHRIYTDLHQDIWENIDFKGWRDEAHRWIHLISDHFQAKPKPRKKGGAR